MKILRGCLVLIVVGPLIQVGIVETAQSDSALTCQLAVTLDERPQLLHWSSDGGSIVWTREDSTTLQVFEIAQSEVATAEIFDLALAWSPRKSTIAWNPSGTQVAVIQENTVTVFNDAGDALYQLAHPARELAWSPSGLFLVTDNNDGMLRFWNAETGRPYWSIEDQYLEGFSWNPTTDEFVLPTIVRTRFTARSTGDSLDIYSLASKTLERTLLLDESYPPALDETLWSPDGSLLLADFENIPAGPVLWDSETTLMVDQSIPRMFGWDWHTNGLIGILTADTIGGTLVVWDVSLNTELARFDFSDFNDENVLYHALWNPTGDSIAVLASRQIYLCELEAETP